MVTEEQLPEPAVSQVSDFIKSLHETEADLDEEESLRNKKRKVDCPEIVFPPGFLAPLNVAPLSQAPLPLSQHSSSNAIVAGNSCNQFWKAGDYEVPQSSACSSSSGMDHARVHPKFLHTNATSHTWALGAFAELLDNSVDEISHGATYVTIDVLQNKKNRSKMLLVQDNGGGMSPSTIRNCMSLGYSGKTKTANTIGQYGNGFKTSTMRLGADVIVFTRYPGKEEEKPTQSIGMLSYTFLRSTGKDDIVVPILDYEKVGSNSWKQIIKSSIQGWNTNLESILQWSPYSSEADLVKEFELMGEQGTRIIIYNLWELEQGKLELDFETDPHDIQLQGVKRDQLRVEEAKKYPSSRHFLTYEHSMRSYASILYLKLPSDFRIILRGEPVKYHSLVDDMILPKQVTYTPGYSLKARTSITLGFVKDAVHHISIQGFNVYHNNRLIKPFWKVWFTAGSGGRGVTGVLEANFVEPAHNKQDFEDTPLLKRLQNVLKDHQKAYWKDNKAIVGYVDPPSNKRPRENFEDNDASLGHMSEGPAQHVSLVPLIQPRNHVHVSQSKGTNITCDASNAAPNAQLNVENQKFQGRVLKKEEDYSANLWIERATSEMVETQSDSSPNKSKVETYLKENQLISERILLSENNRLKHILRDMQSEKSRMEGNLKIKSQQLEELKSKAKSKLMEMAREANAKLKEKDQHIAKLMKEANARSEMVNQDRMRRDGEEANLRMKLTEANAIIEDLQKKIFYSFIKQEPN